MHRLLHDLLGDLRAVLCSAPLVADPDTGSSRLAGRGHARARRHRLPLRAAIAHQSGPGQHRDPPVDRVQRLLRRPPRVLHAGPEECHSGSASVRRADHDRTGNASEQTVYLGYTLLALSLFGALRSAGDEARFFKVVAAIYFVLALGPFLHVAGRYQFPVGGEVVGVPLPSFLLRLHPVHI